MQVFSTSPWVPPEWIKAHGLEPRGIWFAGDFGGAPLPLAAGVCAFANAAVRFAERHVDSAVVFTTHCDQLRRGFDMIAGSYGGRLFLFNLPATWQSAAAERIFASELERLGRFLVKLRGHLPSAKELAAIITQYSLARKRLLEAACDLSARQYAEAIARFHWDGSVNLPSASEKTGSIPLALVGGPLPRAQWHVLDLIEGAGGGVVLNATEAGERSLWCVAGARGTWGSDAGLVPFKTESKGTHEELARLYLDNCIDVFQRPNTRLYAWLKERLTARQVRGLLLWHYVGCDLWRAEAQSLRETFGLPVLLLEANETASDLPRQAGRIEAFIESLTGPRT